MNYWKKLNIGLFLLSGLVFMPQVAFPQDKAELRGVWVATLLNIDWPSAANLSTDQQKQEIISILNHHQSVGINAIFLQVRPAADAFYQSSFEPWSQWLTGAQGKAPGPIYDPLEFWIEQCHQRGMELHAWFNPFRASVTQDVSQLDEDHVVKKHPDWLIKYSGRIYFDPGLPQVREYVENVIMEVVNKYNIDGVHFDDYFYPYKVKDQQFDDQQTYNMLGTGFSKKEDWRRDNVSIFIQSVSDSIGKAKPEVRFGISPSGVWRNKYMDESGSDTRAGQTSYDDLYADVLLWMKEGWIDYLAPQLYWHIGFELADYEILLDWWSRHTYGRHLYIGQSAYKVRRDADFSAWQDPAELPRHIQLNKQYPQVKGNIYFSSSTLRANALGLVDSLKSYHQYPALVPAMVYKPAITLKSPYLYRISHEHKKLTIYWSENTKQNAGERYQVVYRYPGQSTPDIGEPENIVAFLPPGTNSFEDVPPKKGYYTYMVTTVSKTNHESDAPYAMSIDYRKRKPRKKKIKT